MTTRAIHLEMAYSLDTDSCRNAIQRFVCRRGQNTNMRSDNGTNFISAEKELRDSIKNMDHNKIKRILFEDNINNINI